ncbi:MAG: hypothetical protein ACJ72O_15955 [Marmoricola sp.]
MMTLDRVARMINDLAVDARPERHDAEIDDAYRYAQRLMGDDDGATMLVVTAYLRLLADERAGQVPPSARTYLMTSINCQFQRIAVRSAGRPWFRRRPSAR